MIAAEMVEGHDIGNASMKPTPNRRIRNVQFGEKVRGNLDPILHRVDAIPAGADAV
jgi:hypothetical protein